MRAWVEAGSYKYCKLEGAEQYTNTDGGQAFESPRPMVPGPKGDARGKRNDTEDGLAGCAQFRRPAQRVDSARKSLTLAVVCRHYLTVASLASIPPLLLVSAIQMLLT